jgi:hypothetical protein
MSFGKKVDNIINDLKDMNKMYFSLQNKKLSVKIKKDDKKNRTTELQTRPIGYGTNSEYINDADELPAAGIRTTNTNRSHNQWTTSLRRRYYP